MNPQHGAWKSWTLSILLHAALAGVVVAVWMFSSPAPVEQRLAIEGTVVSGSALPPPPPVEPAPPEPIPETPPEAPPEPEPDAAAEQAAAAQQEAERVAEERRLAEERLATERKAEQEAERAAAAAREKAARDKAAREKAEKEKAEKERLAREKAEKDKAERERVAREQAERARTQRESELNAQIAAEERAAAARASGQMQQYVAQITARIERAWIRPPSAAAGLQCEVRVTQVPGGAVTGVQVGRCNGDEAVRQSIEAAVYRASPLPQPSDPALFERVLVVTFRPEK